MSCFYLSCKKKECVSDHQSFFPLHLKENEKNMKSPLHSGRKIKHHSSYIQLNFTPLVIFFFVTFRVDSNCWIETNGIYFIFIETIKTVVAVKLQNTNEVLWDISHESKSWMVMYPPVIPFVVKKKILCVYALSGKWCWRLFNNLERIKS